MTHFKKAAAVATLLGATLPSFGATCDEMIRALTVHSNGRIYFKSDTCSKDPCLLSYANPDAQRAAYELMLSAKARNKPVVLEWPLLNSCGENSLNAIPESVQLN